MLWNSNASKRILQLLHSGAGFDGRVYITWSSSLDAFRVPDFGFRVPGFMFRVSGLGLDGHLVPRHDERLGARCLLHLRLRLLLPGFGRFQSWGSGLREGGWGQVV